MPVSINNYSWRQTEDLVIIRVPLNNIPHKKVDLFSSDSYIKVNYPPYLFECCLYDVVNEEESKCTLVQGEAVFVLAKLEKKEWPRLNKDVSNKDLLKIKKEAIEQVHAKEEKLREKKLDEVSKRKDACIKEQMRMDENDYKTTQNKKAIAKGLAVDEVMKWKQKEADNSILPSPREKANKIIKRLQDSKVDHEKGSQKALNDSILQKSLDEIGKQQNERKEVKNETTNRTKITNSIVKQVAGKKIENDINKTQISETKKVDKDIPPPRQYFSIKKTFTHRAFPTPARESKLKEEQEWLKKQAEARRKIGFMVEDLKPEENDPTWLLQKGKSFHEVGNYLGAISAFTHAIQTWDKIPELYIARSNSQLSIGNFRKVIIDTSEAVDLLKPHVDSNAEMRFQAHYNRGRALLELGKPDAAMADFVEALEIHPYREDIHNLMDRTEALAEEIKSKPREDGETKTEIGHKTTYFNEELLAQ